MPVVGLEKCPSILSFSVPASGSSLDSSLGCHLPRRVKRGSRKKKAEWMFNDRKSERDGF